MPNAHTTLTGLFTDIANAIREKDGTSTTKVADAFPDAIRAIPTDGGGGAQPQRDVNFIDYDGTILHSYTAAEFAALTAMPDNPDHSSDIQWGGHTIPLTSQGWNYTLAKAQAYVAKYGKLWIGQMYKPTDGKLHLCVRMGEGRLKPAMRFTFFGTATIDWGDDTLTNAVSGEDNVHTYAAAGDYDAAIAISEGGTLFIKGDSSSGSHLFQKPETTTGNNERVYQNCIIAAFIPDSAIIDNYAFNSCYSLQSITIPSIPGGLSSIGGHAFEYCYSLQSPTIPDSVTSIGFNAFSDCYGLQSVTIPDSVTIISSRVLKNCYGLQNVTIPDNVTTTIDNDLFNGCYCLRSVTIPDSVTSIGSSVFSGCYGLGFVRFESVTPPNVQHSSAWSSVPTDCIIYVPAASLSAYKSKTNYPNTSTYTYVGY